MKAIKFYKYQGTGNDFVMIDNRNSQFLLSKELIIQLCDRKFGIGSDGLILIENNAECDFEMVFYNPDASQSFCGNGSRCAVAFAKKIEIINAECTFLAIDGTHKAIINNETISILMNVNTYFSKENEDYFINTGSPHYIHFEENIDNLDLLSFGKSIRYSEKYKQVGTNVNVVEKISENEVKIRTYERGVENETLSCGTGVTACALVFGTLEHQNQITINTLGGKLTVRFENAGTNFKNVWLEGPAEMVFEGIFYSNK